MDLYSAMEIGKAWSALGWAQQEQAEALLASDDLVNLLEAGELNPNALYDIRDYMQTLVSFGCDEAEGPLEAIDEFMKANADLELA